LQRTVTDEDGFFEIQNVVPGNYNLIISSVVPIMNQKFTCSEIIFSECGKDPKLWMPLIDHH